MTPHEHIHRARRKSSSRRWREAGWKTYKDAYAAFRAIVRAAVDAGLLGRPLPAQYDEALLWLVSGHPQAEEKIGPGVRYFTVCAVNTRRKDYGRYGFSIVDNRGDERAFELSAALRGENNTKRADVVKAFRYEIRDQILYVRRQAIGQRCVETGEIITEDNCDVDHCCAAFEELLKNFMNSLDFQLEEIETCFTPNTLVHQHMLSDRAIAAKWFEFHRRFARLQALSKSGHARRTHERRNNPLYGLRS